MISSRSQAFVPPICPATRNTVADICRALRMGHACSSKHV